MSIAEKWAALRPSTKATAIVGPLSLVPFLLLAAAGCGFGTGAVFGVVYCLAHDVTADLFSVGDDWGDCE